ncbi:hypothetical protein [Candidatus Ulvibacter alkanivorans]|uniref:hypothetical protein n=1 Tax=Candidatus Ulvibacter alkanivorans TaxID=2267620 RepID=UPI00109C497D|nr:hypothetical protein [Candidatus Ulvibacter alkanivorans]
MKMLNKLLYIVFFLNALNCYSQQIKEDSHIYSGFTVGKASDNSFTRTEPAILNVTFPGNDSIPNSYSIDGYLAYDMKFNPKWSLSLQAERHKNTLIEKEQDNFQFGITVKKLWEIGSNPPPVTLSTGKKITYPCFYLNSELNIKYSQDDKKNTKGLQVIGAFSFELPNPRTNLKEFEFLRPFQYFPGDTRKNGGKASFYPSDLIQIYHTHNIGVEHLEYENLTILNTSFGIKIFPFSGLLYREFEKYGIIELGYSFVGRTDILSSDSQLYVGPLRTYNAKINFWFDDDKKRVLSIGYEHINGGNPLKGLEKNKYGQIAMSALIKQ